MNEPFGWPITNEFRPHWLLRGGHAQTMYAALHQAAGITYSARQHTIDTTEGDHLILHDDCPEDWQNGKLCCLLVHGLGGSHSSPYMTRIAHKLQAVGVRAFRLDMRGCGAGRRCAQKPGHAGRSEDVVAILNYIISQWPASPIVLAGFSLGSNLVLKMLGEAPSHVPRQILRAMTVAPPIDLLACSKNIERWGMFLYNRYFVRSLLREMQLRREFDLELAKLPLQPRPRTLYEFDDRVTAPLSGFSGAPEYYTRSSSAALIAAIRVPTLILAAADDPIVPAGIFASLKPSPYVALHVTRHGGHVGYFARRSSDPDWYWLDWRVVEFVLGQPARASEPKVAPVVACAPG